MKTVTMGFIIFYFFSLQSMACDPLSCSELPSLELPLEASARDLEISKKTKIPINELAKLRLAAKKANGAPYLIRIWYPDSKNERYSKYYRNSTPITLVNGAEPEANLLLPGQSIVHHRRGVDGLLGRYNPYLINFTLSQYMVNKYFEAKLIERYSPQVMPETLLLSELAERLGEDSSELGAELSKRFPDGWVLKRVYDTATTRSFLVTDKMNLAKILKDFQRNSEAFYRERQKILEKHPGANPDTITNLLKRFDRKGTAVNKRLGGGQPFLGFRVAMMLKKPHWTIVQSRLPQILREYRVEALGGRVLGSGSTVYRYQGLVDEHELKEESLEVKKEVKQIEKFVQKEVLDKLPKHIRGVPMGLDIAVVSPGVYKVIETNPGGNSGFLVHSVRGVKALDKFLTKSWVQYDLKNPQIKGLNSAQQLRFIESFADEINLDLDLTHEHLRGKSVNAVVSCKKLLTH